MLRRLIFALCLISPPTFAQNVPGSGISGDQKAAAVSAYTGPGDVVSGASAMIGVRAYNAAYATGSNNAFNYRRASDNTTQNGVILTSGAFDIATANTFAGTDATCQGSTTGLSTTISFTSCSSTPTAQDTVSGSGISQPEYIVSCGSFVAGAGSCTLSTAQNIAVAKTVTMQVALYITEAYDQTGNAVHFLQATGASQPQLFPSCLNGIPCLYFNGANSLITSGNHSITQPVTESIVALALSSLSGSGDLANIGTDGETFYRTGAFVGAYFGTFYASLASTQNVVHNLQYLVNNASSIINQDGTETTGLAFGADAGSAAWSIGAYNNGTTNPLLGYVFEITIYNNLSSSSTQRGNLCHNEYLYYGTSTSC